MDVKSGFKTSEAVALAAGLLVSVLPLVLDKIPPESTWAVVVGSLLAVATYIAGRSHVKATALKAQALTDAAQSVPPSGPTQA